MSFFKVLFCSQEIAKLTRLENEAKSLKTAYRELFETLLVHKSQIEKLKEETIPEPPTWLNEGIGSYRPIVQAVQQNGAIEEIKLLQPQDIYTISYVLKQIVKQNKWKEMTLDKKLHEIWKYVIFRIKYRYDKNESWHYPATTYYRKYGDCEDGTILFVVLARLSGIPANKIFNALGWFDDKVNPRFGHSWAIAEMEDGEWYCFETTIDFYPKFPKRFEGSYYTADWGVSNDIFEGLIKNGKTQL